MCFKSAVGPWSMDAENILKSMSKISKGEKNGFIFPFQRWILLCSRNQNDRRWLTVTEMCVCVCVCVCMCIHISKTFLFPRGKLFLYSLNVRLLISSKFSPNGKFLFFHASPDTGEGLSRVTQAGAGGLASSLSWPAFWGLAWCVAAVYTCWSAFCVCIGAATLHARAPSCSWGLSQSFETYELAAGARACLSQFLGELHVFSQSLDHCPQSRLARQNVTVTAGDILNF